MQIMTAKPLSAREMMKGRKYNYETKREYTAKLFATGNVQVIHKRTYKEPFTMEIEVIKDDISSSTGYSGSD